MDWNNDKNIMKNEIFEKTINPQTNLQTLVLLLRDVNTCNQMDRIKLLLKDLISALGCGFWVQDLCNITELMQILLCRFDFDNELNPFLEELFSLMSFVPLLTNANEILQFKSDIVDYFSFFGFAIFAAKEPKLKKLVIDALRNILLTSGKKSAPICALNKYWIDQFLEHSNLPNIIAEFSSICCNDIYFDLVIVAHELCKVSQAICYKMMESKVLQFVMIRLDPDWESTFGGPRPDHSHLEMPPKIQLEELLIFIATLIDCYAKCSDENVKDKIGPLKVEALWGIRYAFRIYVKNERKFERNFVMALILQIIDCFPNALLLQSGILHDLAILATTSELSCRGHWASQVHFTSDTEDFDFKRMLLISLGQTSHMLGFGKLFQEYHIMTALMKVLQGNSQLKWSAIFYQKLVMTVLGLLERMMDRCVQEFSNCHGVEMLINLLQQILQEKIDCCHCEMISAILKTIYRFFKCAKNYQLINSEELRELQKLQRNLIGAFLDRPMNTAYQNLMAEAFANLYLMPIANNIEDLEIILKGLRRFQSLQADDMKMQHKVFVSCVSLLWKQTCHREKFAQFFVKNEGIYIVLDIIKNAAFVVQLVALGFLADILEEGLGISYFVTWQKDGVSFLQLLLKIFRKECNDIHVKWSSRGLIEDTKFPLMGELQKQFYEEENQHEVSPSYTDMLLSCRPRIYAILQLLQNHNEQKFEVAEEYYKTFESNLSIDDQITKILCENYFVLKLGEAWCEVKGKIEKIQLDLVPFDEFLLEKITAHYDKWGEDILKLQKALLKVEYKNEHYNEEEFYNLLRESKLQGAIRGLMEMRYLSCACNPKLRKLNLHVEKSGKDQNIGMHKTYNVINNFFQSFNQKLIIQSDVIIDPFAESPPHPVSLSDYSNKKQFFDELYSDISSEAPSHDFNCKKRKKAKGKGQSEAK